MIPKRFEDIEYSDLEALLTNEVAESKTLEYKREISSNEKLLAGVSALANSSGGDFIIGIEAKDGIPINLKGVVIKNVDDEILRLEQILQNGLEPRLPSKNIKHIQSPNSEDFFLIRVSQSWIAPHRVKCRDKEFNDKFYGRHSGGKYPMDVSELRTAFMLSEQISEKIKNFRKERVTLIKTNDELPVELPEGGKMILHLLPLSAFTSLTSVDLSKVRATFDLSLELGSFNRKINLDGVFSSSPSSEDQKSRWYIQLFRNGCMETVFPLSETLQPTFTNTLFSSLGEQIKLLKLLNIEFPLYVFISAVNVKGYKIDSKSYYRTMIDPIDRNDLLLPEVIIDDPKQKTGEILRPLFDMLWNAFGLERCTNYDSEGNYKPNG